MEIKDRIKMIMDKEHAIAGVFADSIGIQQSTLSHILKGRNRPSLDIIMKIHQRYPAISLEWLIYGTGEMTPSNIADENREKSEPVSSFSPTAPTYRSLFDEQHSEPSQATIKHNSQQEKTDEQKPAAQPTVIKEIQYVEKAARKITEIRIFFDDNTYEIFRPEK